MKNSKRAVILLPLGGLLAGFTNGLLGAGGGIIIVYVLSSLLGKEAERRDIFANALCVMVPISVLSCIIYALRKDIDIGGFGPFILPAVAGGLVGGLVLHKIDTSLLKKLFAILVVISGVILVLK